MNYLKKNKYHAKKIITDQGTFDSKKEYQRYKVLKELENVGVIRGLQRQVKFELIPAQYGPGSIITKGKNTGKIKPGPLIERACYYMADFCYWRGNEYVVEDVKSDVTRTPEYIIKRKLMLQVHKIKIKEV